MIHANLLCFDWFENTRFGAGPSPVPAACVPVCAVCGAGDSDEGDNFGLITGRFVRDGDDLGPRSASTWRPLVTR